MRLLPRIPTLRAHRLIRKGEEILFNYGTSLPFVAHNEKVEEEGEVRRACGQSTPPCPPPPALAPPPPGPPPPPPPLRHPLPSATPIPSAAPLPPPPLLAAGR